MHVSHRAHAAFHYSTRPLQSKPERRAEDNDTGRVREVRRRPEDDRKGPSREQRSDAERQDETADTPNDPIRLETAARQAKVDTWSPAGAAMKTTALWSLLGNVPDAASSKPAPEATLSTPKVSSLEDLLSLAISKP